MTFTALVLAVEAEDLDPLSDALLDAGALSVSCEDARAEPAADAPHFGGSGESVSWTRVKLTALCKVQPDPEQLLLHACRSNCSGSGWTLHRAVSFTRVQDTDSPEPPKCGASAAGSALASSQLTDSAPASSSASERGSRSSASTARTSAVNVTRSVLYLAASRFFCWASFCSR